MLQKLDQNSIKNIIKMQKQIWNPFFSFLQIGQYPQPQYFQSVQSPFPLYTFLYDFPDQDFRFQSAEIQQQKKNQILFRQQNSKNIPNLPQVDQQGQGSSLNDQRKQVNEQKDKDRNIVSNSLKVFRKYASDSTKVGGSIIQNIIQKNNLCYTVDEFSKDLDRKIPRERNYLGIKFLRALLWKKDKNSNFTIVFRTLLHHYYKCQVYPTVLTSTKILSEAKSKQVAGVRRIFDHM